MNQANKQLPAYQERIKADAEAASKYLHDDEGVSIAYYEGHKEGYIAGATAERNLIDEAIDKALHAERNKMQAKFSDADKQWAALLKQQNDRAQVLADALEKILKQQDYYSVIELAANALQQWKGECNTWQPIETAPKDGSTIEVTYDTEGKETCLAMWSEKPVCMLGPRNGSFSPGWATPVEADCDTNLPLDPPLMWRERKGGGE